MAVNVLRYAVVIFNGIKEQAMIAKEQITEWFCKTNKIKKEELDKYHRYAIATTFKYVQDLVKNNAVLPLVMPSAFEKLTDKELEEAEHSKLSEIAELHKQWKAILNEQFYRKHPECKPH
jgi:hypothetical protein